ncbi:hypothetical protein [Paenibacillus sp. TH7-28]
MSCSLPISTNHVRDGRKFWIDEAEGIKALRIISELYRSSRTK